MWQHKEIKRKKNALKIVESGLAESLLEFGKQSVSDTDFKCRKLSCEVLQPNRKKRLLMPSDKNCFYILMVTHGYISSSEISDHFPLPCTCGICARDTVCPARIKSVNCRQYCKYAKREQIPRTKNQLQKYWKRKNSNESWLT